MIRQYVDRSNISMLMLTAFVLILIVFFVAQAAASRADAVALALGTESQRLTQLSLEVARLRAIVEPGPPVPPPAPPAPVVVTPMPAAPPPLPVFVASPPPALEPKPVEETQPEPPPPPPFEPAEPPVPSLSWEERIGGNLLNKLGALILVIGIALFLGYSFANMGPVGRSLTGVAIGAALLGGGVWVETKDNYRLFSRGLIASGWASLYFTSYAMSSLEAARVIQSPLAGLLLMAATATAMVVHSLRYRVQSLTMLAYACVFAAFALSDLNTLVALALVPLAASMLYLARRMEWNDMALAAAAATYAVFLTRPSTGSPLAAIQGMLFVFWLLFEAFDIFFRRSGERPGALFALNALAGLGASAAIWHRMRPAEISYLCMGVAVLYLGSAILRAVREDKVYAAALGVSIAATALAVLATASGMWTSLMLLLEAELVFLAGHHLRLRPAVWFSWIVFGGAFVTGWPWAFPLAAIAGVLYGNRYLEREGWYWSWAASFVAAAAASHHLALRHVGDAWLLLGAVLFAFRSTEFRLQAYILASLGTLLAAADFGSAHPLALAVALVATFLAHFRLSYLPAIERSSILHAGAAASAFLTATLLESVVPRPYAGISMMIAALAYFELGIRRVPGAFVFPALGLAALGYADFFAGNFHLFGTAATIPQHTGRILGAALAHWFAFRMRLDYPRLGRAAFTAGSMLTSFALLELVPKWSIPIALAAQAILAAELGYSVNAILLGAAATGSLVWWGGPFQTLFVAASMWGIALRTGQRAYGWAGTAILLVYAPLHWAGKELLVWCGAGAGFAVASRRYAESLLHALAIALVATVFSLVAAPGAWQQALTAGWMMGAVVLVSDPIFRRAFSISAAVVVAALLFREASGGMLTVSWSLEAIALLGIGFLVRERSLRLCGLALLLGCIGKAFLYDLRNLEAVYRILSFVGLGVSLLGVSWLYSRVNRKD